jgi:hypothetical protein
MPAARAGESKQALVITLVFFILLSIVLGVFTYMGYNDADKNLKDKTTAENAEKTAKSERDSQKYAAMMARTYFGKPPADKKELTIAYEEAGKLAAKGDDNGKAVKEMEEMLGWNKAGGLPGADMISKVAAAEKKSKDLQDMVAQKEEEAKKHKLDADNARKRQREAEDNFKKALDDLNARADADLKRYQKVIEQQALAFGDQSKTIEQLKDDGSNKDAKYKKLEDAKKKSDRDFQTQIDKLEDKKPKFTAAMFDQPRGKIVSMDRSGTMPFINLGKADRVRPQLTFSIHSVGSDGKPAKESKGSLEVFNVLSDHLSQARITSQVDATRDPVVSGDVLMNATWDPNQKRHVAIAGIIDLTGEGLVDRPTDALRAVEEFKRTLENQDMIVDAWIDFVDNSIKGKGITPETDYLILGDVPKTRGGIIRDSDTKEKRQDDVVKLRTRMQEEATKVGVPVIRLRDFLTMTGYRVPRTKETPDIGGIHKALTTGGSPIEKAFKPKEGETKPADK